MKNFFNTVNGWMAQLRQKANVILAGAGLALSGVAMALVGLPAHPLLHGNPFDITMDGVMSGAQDMFNGLWPAFTPIIGIQFGIALLLMVMGLIAGIFLGIARKKG